MCPQLQLKDELGGCQPPTCGCGSEHLFIVQGHRGGEGRDGGCVQPCGDTEGREVICGEKLQSCELLTLGSRPGMMELDHVHPHLIPAHMPEVVLLQPTPSTEVPPAVPEGPFLLFIPRGLSGRVC